MDTGRGSFKPVSQPEYDQIRREAAESPSDSRLDRIFHTGETVRVKDSVFKIRSIDFLSGIMTLKLLPKE